MEDVAPCARAIGGGCKDVFEELEVAAEGFLVGCDDANTLLQEGRVCIGDILVRGVVDKDDFAGRLDEVVL